MIVYTIIVCVMMLLGLGAVMQKNEGQVGAGIFEFLILLPIFGRIFGWW